MVGCPLNENTAAESDRGLFFLFPQKCSDISSTRKPGFLLTLVVLKAAVVSSNGLGLQLSVNQASHFAILVSMGSINRGIKQVRQQDVSCNDRQLRRNCFTDFFIIRGGWGLCLAGNFIKIFIPCCSQSFINCFQILDFSKNAK